MSTNQTLLLNGDLKIPPSRHEAMTNPVVITFPKFTPANVSSEVNGTVRHYLINVSADGLYYLAENHLFESIPQMIEYHQHNGAGVGHFLNYVQTPTLEIMYIHTYTIDFTS